MGRRGALGFVSGPGPTDESGGSTVSQASASNVVASSCGLPTGMNAQRGNHEMMRLCPSFNPEITPIAECALSTGVNNRGSRAAKATGGESVMPERTITKDDRRRTG